MAKDEVQRVLQLSEEKRKLWEQAWDDHKKRLEQCLQVSQFYFDLKQVSSDHVIIAFLQYRYQMLLMFNPYTCNKIRVFGK